MLSVMSEQYQAGPDYEEAGADAVRRQVLVLAITKQTPERRYSPCNMLAPMPATVAGNAVHLTHLRLMLKMSVYCCSGMPTPTLPGKEPDIPPSCPASGVSTRDCNRSHKIVGPSARHGRVLLPPERVDFLAMTATPIAGK